ncbi:MAG: saccharopine dehydrogenase NADP-binding domain-containing protein [Planctomycetia bacterium]|nr:saccharopine dehydrogenase NADP-binding domain-containing protein [Planctomycetia bacterium]
MPFKYAILGAGRQGACAAYGLAKFGEAEMVTLADMDESVAAAAAKRVNALAGREVARAARLDASDPVTTRTLLKGHHAAVSCVPYFLNVDVARAAMDARVHFCDLGGNTEVVERELALHPEASKHGLSLIPDCGLAPGLGNTLAALAVEQFDAEISVHVRCGGLPQDPKPPLSYMLVFSIHGLINEYTGEAECLRNGKIVRVPTIAEFEPIEMGGKLGTLQCATTSGGTSTAPKTFAGRVKDYDYKTIRYPGHWDRIRTLLELGLLDAAPVTVGPNSIRPRDVTAACLIPRLTFKGDKDLVILRVWGEGKKAGKAKRVQYDVLDYGDEATGFTAMERTTAYPAALVAQMMAAGETMRGAIPLETAVPARAHVDRLKGWGIGIRES